MTHAHVRITADDSQQASARTVCVVGLVSTVDSKTERLHVLLMASNGHHCIARTFSYLAIVDVCRLSREINTTFE